MIFSFCFKSTLPSFLCISLSSLVSVSLSVIYLILWLVSFWTVSTSYLRHCTFLSYLYVPYLSSFDQPMSHRVPVLLYSVYLTVTTIHHHQLVLQLAVLLYINHSTLLIYFCLAFFTYLKIVISSKSVSNGTLGESPFTSVITEKLIVSQVFLLLSSFVFFLAFSFYFLTFFFISVSLFGDSIGFLLSISPLYLICYFWFHKKANSDL